MTYNLSAILKDAHGRTSRQWQKQGYKSYADGFKVYLAQAWYTAKREARQAAQPLIIHEGTRAYAELATDGRLA